MPELTKVDEITIRGTILAINPAKRTVVVQSAERDTLTFKAIDRVTNFASLKPGQLVDVRYYRVTDYLVAKTTFEVTDMAREMVRDPARAPGLPGTEMRARLWSLEGMVVRTDMAARKIEIVDPNGGDHPLAVDQDSRGTVRARKAQAWWYGHHGFQRTLGLRDHASSLIQRPTGLVTLCGAHSDAALFECPPYVRSLRTSGPGKRSAALWRGPLVITCPPNELDGVHKTELARPSSG